MSARAASRLEALRREFDDAFARTPAPIAEAPARLLAIRAGGAPFALRLDELAGVARDEAVAPVPGGPPELVGIAAIRGRIVPVFDLAALLGLEATGRRLRWLAVARAEDPVALSFERVERAIEAGPDDVRAVRDAPAAHVRELVRTAAGLVPVLAVAPLLDAIRDRAIARSSDARGGREPWSGP